jgi:hypothetical protein
VPNLVFVRLGHCSWRGLCAGQRWRSLCANGKHRDKQQSERDKAAHLHCRCSFRTGHWRIG